MFLVLSTLTASVVLDLLDENAGAIGLHFGAGDFDSFVLNLALQMTPVCEAVESALSRVTNTQLPVIPPMEEVRDMKLMRPRLTHFALSLSRPHCQLRPLLKPALVCTSRH